MRYGIAPPRSRLIDDREWGIAETADTVFVADEAFFTGVLDATGSMIFRYRDPIGFRPRREES